MKNSHKKLLITTAVTFAALELIAHKKKPSSVYADEPSEKNPMEGKKVVFVSDENEPENADGARGHLKSVAPSKHSSSFYEKYAKHAADKALSFAGLVVLSPVMAAISLAIKIEDPGPVLFTQKRVGKDKQFFKLHKFRSMKMNTPHDIPTHMLENPDQYITKVGAFLRKHSLDELPQIWDIFLGNMSVVGPRPALYNQDVLVSERDKYDANDVTPGLTGLAQINGRDELSIPDKARLDGKYTKALNAGGLKAFQMDIQCFLGSLGVFAEDDSVVEGKAENDNEHFGCDAIFSVNKSSHKKILIIGAHSYIGTAFAEYVRVHYPSNFTVDSVPARTDETGRSDFDRLSDEALSSYDIVYHLAGIAHSDTGDADENTRKNYYRVNTDLAVHVAERCKAAGIKTFIFMSSMIVYGDKTSVITKDTIPSPANFYGDSKWQADKQIRSMADDDFKVYVLRPPMIYGKGSKGNYPKLASLAKRLPIFPDIKNCRSMLYIGNLCEFLCQLMISDVTADANAMVFMPQNRDYVRTSRMVREIAITSGKHPTLVSGFDPLIKLLPGKLRTLANKAFGSFFYDHSLSEYNGLDYQKYDLRESIILTEG